MTPLEVLADPHAPPSVVWAVVEQLLGPGARVYEPETLQLELERRGASWESLAPKVLGAQTILATRVWTWDWRALFAFALACEGVPAGDTVAHPRPDQIAWAVDEIGELVGTPMTDEHGFDPDAVDPAIALVLHDDGWVLAPEPLGFVQSALDRLNHDHDGLRAKVEAARARSADPDESLVGVQLARLADTATERAARREHRERLRASLTI